MVHLNMHKNINYFHGQYKKYGTALIEPKSYVNPLDCKDFQELKICCDKVEKEFIKIGDAGEENFLSVGRFMTDIKKPTIVKNSYSKKVIQILGKKKYVNLFKKIIGVDENEKIYLRRIQFNQINKGCFVGYHLDIDSNPDYIAAVVIQFGENYLGGKYRVYNSKVKFRDYTPKKKSIIVSDCNYPHEVTKVTKGERQSLVFFISKNYDKNKRKN